MADVRLQSRDEVAARIAELRPLTMNDPSSDMNRLLDEVACGEDQLLASTVAIEDGRVVGWASAEQFRRQVVAGVFVHPDNRCQGIGARLVTMLLEELDRLRPGVRPKTGPERFWRRFLVNPLKPPVYIRRMGKLIDKLRVQLRDRDEPLWTDADLEACLRRTADAVGAITGDTYATAADLASTHPTSRSILITGGMFHALWMLVEEATQAEDGTWSFRGRPVSDFKADVFETLIPNTMASLERSLEKLEEVFGFIRAAKAS